MKRSDRGLSRKRVAMGCWRTRSRMKRSSATWNVTMATASTDPARKSGHIDNTLCVVIGVSDGVTKEASIHGRFQG